MASAMPLRSRLPRSKKLTPAPGDQVLHGPGYQALARLGQRSDSRSDVHCNTTHIIVANFDLTRVKPGANFDTQ